LINKNLLSIYPRELVILSSVVIILVDRFQKFIFVQNMILLNQFDLKFMGHHYKNLHLKPSTNYYLKNLVSAIFEARSNPELIFLQKKLNITKF
jgi:hypothetical protein